MPKKKSERQPWEVEFVSVPLSRESALLAVKGDDNFSKTERTLMNALTKSAKVSLAYNVTTSSFICSVTVPDPETGTVKKCFSSHAPDMLDACRLAAYKIDTVLDGDVFNLHSANVTQEMYG